jgi:hypothetical protein
MKMILKDAHAKPQSRKEIQMSKAQLFFAPLRLCVSICLLSFAVGARAETTNDLSDAEVQGRQLAQQLCEARPQNNFTNIGVLKVRDANGKTVEAPIKFEAIVTQTNWSSTYQLLDSTNLSHVIKMLTVLHEVSNSNRYWLHFDFGGNRHWTKDGQTVIKLLSFAGDFGCADLGLEFFHWPEQKILKKEVKRSRGCSVLESTNPNPSTNGYSRVVSWIDEESGGIVQAFAYDAQGKKLKEFYPKNFEKVNGQYQVQEMEMDNVQTGSRSRIEFDLNKQ